MFRFVAKTPRVYSALLPLCGYTTLILAFVAPMVVILGPSYLFLDWALLSWSEGTSWWISMNITFLVAFVLSFGVAYTIMDILADVVVEHYEKAKIHQNNDRINARLGKLRAETGHSGSLLDT